MDFSARNSCLAQEIVFALTLRGTGEVHNERWTFSLALAHW